MKKILFLMLGTLLALSISGCKDKEPDMPENAPTITLNSGTVTDTEFNFTIKTDTGTEYAYMIKTGDDSKKYTGEDVFNEGTQGNISGSETVKLTGLTPETSYIAYVTVRNGESYSAVPSLKFTTKAKKGDGDDPAESSIKLELLEVTQSSFSFKIHGDMMTYKFFPVEKLLFENSQYEKGVFLNMFGIYSEGEQVVEWIDGEQYLDYPMDVAPDREYYVFAAESDGENLTGEVAELLFRTPAAEKVDGAVKVSISGITSTSVLVKSEPAANLTSYLIYVRDKQWTDEIIELYGESMLQSLIQNESSGSRTYTAATEETWGDLTPETDYYVMSLGKSGDKLTEVGLIEFKTTEAELGEPIITLSAKPAPRAPHEIISINIKCDNASLLRYYVLSTLEYDLKINDGATDMTLIEDFGTTLGEEEVDAAVNYGGVDIMVDNLWYETSYTVIVAARNYEGTEAYETTSVSTEAKPVPDRVESPLFEELLGTWTASYDYIDYGYIEQSVTGEVVIASGADDQTEEYFREQNMLVVQGFPFQTEEIPYVSPQTLKETDPFWSENPNFAMRDFGPKIFLQINADGSVCVPTAKNVYLYNWSEDGVVYFFGCDMDNEGIAPVTFPVEISADRNTITIKECVAGSEFMNGTYTPSVFLDWYGQPWMRACATSDIVLTRK